MGRLDGKVAIVTGAARGMGAATVRRFAAEGARVVAADVLDAETKALADELGEAVLFVHLDVSSEADWAEAVRITEERFGSVDVLVNNAGILKLASIEQTTIDDFMQMVSVNQLGVFLGTKAVVPAMKRAGAGSIVNLSSVDGLRGSPATMAYGSTKFAVRGMTKVTALEFGHAKIRANSVHPGAIDTPMMRAQGLEGIDLDAMYKGIPIKRAGKPEDVANMILFLASDESSYVTGQEFVVDGGASIFIGWFSKHPEF